MTDRSAHDGSEWLHSAALDVVRRRPAFFDI
jgi:hypothetical protein